MIASLTLSIEDNGTPRYEQLRQQLLSAIEQERLKVGDKLPSSRALAQMLGVSRSVVMQTYDQLISEGLLVSQPKRGVFVAQREWLHSPVATVVPKPTTSSLQRFDSGVDVSVFPNKAWAASMRRAWLNPDPRLLKGEYEAGYPPLQQATCDYLYALRGLECEPEQIILVAGNHDAVSLLQHALSDTVQHWLLENPTYPPLRASFSAARTQDLTITEQGVQPLSLAQPWAAALTPNRQYPLGVCASSATREAWFSILADSHNFVIEDDYDNEFVYQGHVAKPWFQAAQHRQGVSEQIFYIGSFSKVLFRGLRLGFIVAPLSQVPRVLDSQKTLGLFASQTLQPVVTDFLVSGAFYRHLNRMKRHYRSKRDYLLSLLEQCLSPWFTWQKPTGGMHVVIYVKTPFSDGDWCRELNQHCLKNGLRLSWLQDHYGVANAAPKGLVLGFTGPTELQLDAWIKQLADVCQTLASKQSVEKI